MWIWLGSGEIGFFNGNNWTLFSKQDYGLQDTPYDMAIGPDGAVWVSGRQAISRYQKGHWVAFGIPDASETAFPRLAIDPSGVVWLAMPGCYCGNSIRKFDGINWDSLWTYVDGQGEASQILFTPDGTLWAALEFPGSIGRYDGKTWKFYSDLWLEGPNSGIRIASDSMSNIFGIAAGREWIVRISKDGSISRIPFDYTDLELNEFLLSLFIDKQGTIWVNAELKNTRNASLAYYKNNQWVAFTNLPFDTVTDFNELPDGTLLVATSRGLYQFKSAR